MRDLNRVPIWGELRSRQGSTRSRMFKSMIVYGDPKFERRYGEVVNALAARIRAIDSVNLDQLRTLLIQAGQLEQAVFDSGETNQDCRQAAARLTDCVAVMFYDAFLRNRSSPSNPGSV